MLLIFQPIYNWVEINENYKEDLFNVNGLDGNFTLVNGLVKPVISVTQGQWTRLRIINTAWELLHFNFSVDGCEHSLLAKNGVYVANFPRAITGALVPGGGRADVMVRCNSPGSYDVLAYVEEFVDVVAATMSVTQSSDIWPPLGGLEIDVSTYSDYLKDTVHAVVDPAINGDKYEEMVRLHTAVLDKQKKIKNKKRSSTLPFPTGLVGGGCVVPRQGRVLGTTHTNPGIQTAVPPFLPTVVSTRFYPFLLFFYCFYCFLLFSLPFFLFCSSTRGSPHPGYPRVARVFM